MGSDLELLVYDGTALSRACSQLPGLNLERAIRGGSLPGKLKAQTLISRLTQACRKLCLMWEAGDLALEAEREFLHTTVREAPALWGREAVNVHYHLEAFVLFSRAALDVAAYVFGSLLPKPFPRGAFDSFNQILRNIERHGPAELKSYFSPLQSTPGSWVSTLAGTQRGRSLRDIIAHQEEFPLSYEELHHGSEKEYAVVWVEGLMIPLPVFVNNLREGVVSGFSELERHCAAALLSA